MKKKLILLVAFVMVALLCACAKKEEAPKADEPAATETTIPEAPDYTKADFWASLPETADKDVDTFYVCPTLTAVSEFGDFASIDEMRAPSEMVKTSMSSAFAEDTNIYMPLYRQVAFSKAEKMNKDGIAYAEFLKANVTYEDVVTALDYYFDNYNNGRPFILAGHSQGSCICYLLLEDYFKQHPDYLERMVAAYPIGWARDTAYYEKNDHLKFAEGESDAGVIISWNTMGPGAVEDTIVLPKNAVAINPINWKKDDTYAGPEENKGSFVNGEIVMNYADAKLNLERGYVECNTEMEYLVNDLVLGDKSLHGGDYQLYYNNIKENAKKRINTFLGKENTPEAPDYTSADAWVLMPETPDKEVDTFFIYPTVVMQSEYGNFASTDEALEHISFVTDQMSSAFTDSTNVYMPLYRQIALSYAATMDKDAYTYKECIHNNLPYEDLEKALDYYFENCNNGRPFILAGHSQGSCSCFVVLENYMKEHPEYLERMVATYALGFGMDEAYYEKNTHLKFAEGETDTGVIISWNTMGPGATEKTMIMAEPCVAINPINWKRDDTYASAEENLGSLVDGKIVMNYADAKVNQERGYVESNTEMEYMVMDAVFGDKCLHGGDYPLFYNNIKDNVAKRIAAYLDK